jgi:choice-of-anchor C domain-containing protein
MRNGPIRRYLSAVALVLGVTGVSQADLINGSFELGVNPPSTFYSTLPGGSTDISGWKVLGAGVDWVHNDFWRAQDGSRSLDLSALAAGGVMQEVATTAGADYTLSFWMSINPDHRHIAARFLDVTVTDVGSNFDLVSNMYGVSQGTRTHEDMQWEFQTISFTATGALTRLSFFTDPMSSDAGGPALDNVTLEGGAVTPVPAPAAVVLAGLGVGVIAVRRRVAARI